MTLMLLMILATALLLGAAQVLRPRIAPPVRVELRRIKRTSK
jgi:hypothetical protein